MVWSLRPRPCACAAPRLRSRYSVPAALNGGQPVEQPKSQRLTALGKHAGDASSPGRADALRFSALASRSAGGSRSVRPEQPYRM